MLRKKTLNCFGVSWSKAVLAFSPLTKEQTKQAQPKPISPEEIFKPHHIRIMKIITKTF